MNSYTSNQKENVQYNISDTLKGYLGKNKKDDHLNNLKKEPLLKPNYAGLNFSSLNNYNHSNVNKSEEHGIRSHRSRISDKNSTKISNPSRSSMYLKEKSLNKGKYSSSSNSTSNGLSKGYNSLAYKEHQKN